MMIRKHRKNCGKGFWIRLGHEFGEMTFRALLYGAIVQYKSVGSRDSRGPLLLNEGKKVIIYKIVTKMLGLDGITEK